ncbi:MAG: cation:proton antiporter [Euryarchaeota archaeon]|nr:cation:proton antiporter [Euryarchaeota archaeon]
MPVEVIGILTAIFVIAATLLLAASRFSLPVIPFYVLAGVIAGFFIPEEQLIDLAQWGIAFLVFVFGIEFEISEFRATGTDSAIVAVVQLSATGLLAYLAGLGVGLGSLDALYLAVAATLSSSLVSLGHLEGVARPRTAFERLSEGIHFVEDLVAIALILGLSALVYSAQPAPLQIAAGVGLLLAGVLIRRYLFEFISGLADDTEIMMLVGISFVIGFVALSELAGISIVVGAFAAGIAIAREYPYNIGMIDAIGDLEDFFSPIFFITVGALVAIPTVPTIGYALILVVAVVLLNPAITILTLLWRGYDPRTATLTGTSLDQISEFSLIIAISAFAAETISQSVFEAIILAAVVTMITTAYTGQYAEEIHRALAERGLLTSDQDKIADRSHVTEELSDHVIVVGFGTEGEEVAQACEAANREYVVIENDPLLIEEVSEAVDNYAFGDMMGESVWEKARVERAALIVSTVVEEERSARVLDLDTDADVIVRATDEESAKKLFERGALYVAVPDLLAAEFLASQVETVLEADENRREELRERSREKIESAKRG